MKLISCEDCGVVIDLEKIEWKIKTEQVNDFDKEKVLYCPACKSRVVLEKD